MTLNELKENLANGILTFEDLECFYKEQKYQLNEFIGLVDYASKISDEPDKYKKLLLKIKGKNMSDLIESFEGLGYAIKKDKNLKDAFEHMGYRLLEQTRVGKRDEVFHNILRIFVANKQKFPNILVEAFKPIYTDQMFKVFIFSFLSGLIGQEQN